MSTEVTHRATDDGGKREAVLDEAVGTIVAFGDSAALERALDAALRRTWERGQIRKHAQSDDWESGVDQLCKAFESEPSRPIEVSTGNATHDAN